MRHLSFKTQSANEKIVQRDWYVVDATNQTLGRMSSRIASRTARQEQALLHCRTLIAVIMSSLSTAGKVVLTGNKLDDKEYQTFIPGYPGGQKIETAKNMISRRPNLMIERAVKGMLPKNRLGRAMYKKLIRLRRLQTHPHTAQQPKEMK